MPFPRSITWIITWLVFFLIHNGCDGWFLVTDYIKSIMSIKSEKPLSLKSYICLFRGTEKVRVPHIRVLKIIYVMLAAIKALIAL